MKAAAIHCAVAIALAGALALPAPSSTPTRMQAERNINVSQYCIPAESLEAHRFYCRLGG